MLSRLSAWSLFVCTTLSFVHHPTENPGLPEHLLDDDDWGEVKNGFQYYKDDEDEDQNVDAPFDAKKESALDQKMESFIHDGMITDEDLQEHHSPEAYYQRKAAREEREAAIAAIKGETTDDVFFHHSPDLVLPMVKDQMKGNKAFAEEKALDTVITEGLTSEEKAKAGIIGDDMTAEEMGELMTLMGHFNGMHLDHLVTKTEELQDDNEAHNLTTAAEVQEDATQSPETGTTLGVPVPKVQPPMTASEEQRLGLKMESSPATPRHKEQVSGPFTMGRHSGKEEPEEDEEQATEALEKVSKGFRMGLKPGSSGIVRAADGSSAAADESQHEAGFVDHGKAKTTTTTVIPEIVRGAGQRTTEADVIAQLSAVEPGQVVATKQELLRMKEELKDHPKVLKALQAGISSGVIQGMNSSFSWEIVARTAEWAAQKSMEETNSKAQGAIFGAAQNNAALLGLRSAGDIQMRVQTMMDKEIRRNSKSQDHRLDADQIVRAANDWIAEQIVAKQILNITDLDLGMIMKAMVLGASRSMSRCPVCHETAKAAAVAAADLTMEDVAKRIQQAKELQENSKDSGVLQAYMFAIIWGRDRATKMGITEDEIDWNEVTMLAKKKAEEVRKANPNSPKKDPFKAAKQVVKEYLRKHAHKGLDAFKQLAKESHQRVKDKTQL